NAGLANETRGDLRELQNPPGVLSAFSNGFRPGACQGCYAIVLPSTVSLPFLAFRQHDDRVDEHGRVRVSGRRSLGEVNRNSTGFNERGLEGEGYRGGRGEGSVNDHRVPRLGRAIFDLEVDGLVGREGDERGVPGYANDNPCVGVGSERVCSDVRVRIRDSVRGLGHALAVENKRVLPGYDRTP